MYFQFEIITIVLVSSFRPFEYLCYGSMAIRKYFNSFSAGIVFIRQNLTSIDVIFWRIKFRPYDIKRTGESSTNYGHHQCHSECHRLHHGLCHSGATTSGLHQAEDWLYMKQFCTVWHRCSGRKNLVETETSSHSYKLLDLLSCF